MTKFVYRPESVTWSRDPTSQDLVIKPPMGAKAGDRIIVEYAYRQGEGVQAATVTPTGIFNVRRTLNVGEPGGTPPLGYSQPWQWTPDNIMYGSTTYGGRAGKDQLLFVTTMGLNGFTPDPSCGTVIASGNDGYVYFWVFRRTGLSDPETLTLGTWGSEGGTGYYVGANALLMTWIMDQPGTWVVRETGRGVNTAIAMPGADAGELFRFRIIPSVGNYTPADGPVLDDSGYYGWQNNLGYLTPVPGIRGDYNEQPVAEGISSGNPTTSWAQATAWATGPLETRSLDPGRIGVAGDMHWINLMVSYQVSGG